MSRINHKEQEIKKVASMILDAEDYEKILQKINGYRMGLTNRFPADKRINLWKQLIEMYK